MSSIALRYTNDADEAIQRLNEGFYKVLQKLDQYKDDFALATWIRRILVNHLIDTYRKEQRQLAKISLHDDYEGDGTEHTVNLGEQKLEEKDLRNLLNSLPEMTGKVFNLYAIDGFKHREIAEMLGMSEGTSKWHVNEARRRLKVQLERMYAQEKKMIEVTR